jgi:ribosomal protein S3AE
MAIAKKKKKFWDVDMPILNKETQLYSYSIEELKDRFITYDLTRLLRGKNALLQLKVEITEGNPTSIPTEFRILPTFLRKMVRKGTSYVEDSFFVQCKDAKIEIKPFLIARRKVSRSIRSTLREKAKIEIIDYVKDKTSDTIFKEILKNQLQKILSLKLKKIYPLSLCEIRAIRVVKQEGNRIINAPTKNQIKEVKKTKQETEEEPEEE